MRLRSAPTYAARDEAVREIAIRLCGPAFNGEEEQTWIGAWVDGQPGDLDAAHHIAATFPDDSQVLAEGRALAHRLVNDREFRAQAEFLAAELAQRHYMAGPAVGWLLASEVGAC